MKNFFVSLLSLLAVGCLSVGFAGCGERSSDSQESGSSFFETDENSLAYALSEDGSYYSVCGIGNYEGTEVVVPDSFRNLPVKEIDEGAFQESAITEVTLPDTVTSIGKSAFDYCKELQTVTFGNSVTTVGELAFSNCEALQKVVFGNSVQTIEAYAFQNCLKLEFFALPNTLKSIGKAAFFGVALRELVLPDSVEILSDRAFSSCQKLKKVTLSKGLQTVGRYAFMHCAELLRVDIGDSVTTIGAAAFSQCDKLQTVYLGTALTTVEELAFAESFFISTVHYRGSLSDWCAISFEDKHANPISVAQEFYIQESLLTGELVIPDEVPSIGAFAFYQYIPLTSVVIGEGVTSIGTFAFQDTSITSASFKNPTGWKVKDYDLSMDFSNPETSANVLNGWNKLPYHYVREA